MVVRLHRCRVILGSAAIPWNERIQSNHTNSRDAWVSAITAAFTSLSSPAEQLSSNPPQYMLDMGKQTSQFFNCTVDVYGQKQYKLKSLEQYSREHSTNEQPGKQYFKANSLPEIIQQAPMPSFKSSPRQAHEIEKGGQPGHLYHIWLGR